MIASTPHVRVIFLFFVVSSEQPKYLLEKSGSNRQMIKQSNSVCVLQKTE